MKNVSDFLRKIDPLVHLFFLIAIIILSYGYLTLSGRINSFSSSVAEFKNKLSSFVIPTPLVIDTDFLVEATPSVTSSPSPKPKSTSSVDIKKSTTYINLGSTFSTTSGDWVDIKSTDVYLDIENEYSKDAYVDWEAAVSIGSASGKVYVRLFDVTHSIAVNGSELMANAVSSSRVSSPRLYFWAGHNLYRVQIKSTPPYTANFDSGKIKIVY